MKKDIKYNHRLLPRRNYRFISNIHALKQFFLCRLTNRRHHVVLKKDNWYSVWDESELRRGMSVNLLSCFKHYDAQIRIKGRIGDPHFEHWQPNDNPIHPHRIEFRKHANFIGVRIKDILELAQPNIDVTFKNGTTRSDKVKLSVRHVPTKCNFWHFEIGIIAIDHIGNEYEFMKNDNISKKGRGRFQKKAAEILNKLIFPHLKHSSDCYPIYLEKSYYK